MSTSKILFVDLESPRAHQEVDWFFLQNVFPHFQEKYFLLERYLYEEIAREHGVGVEGDVYFFPSSAVETRRRGRVSVWLKYMEKLRFVLQFMESKQIDTVYFITYDTVSLSLLVRKFLGYHVILHNHDNIARFIKTAARRFLFKRLGGFHHVIYSSALDSSIRSYLEKQAGVGKVFFIDYPVDDGENRKPRRYSPDSTLLLAPSASGDPGKILRLLNSTPSDRIRVRAKVADEWYNKYPPAFRGNLFTGFMAKAEFASWMEESDFVLLLYPRDYRFRLSALLFDAIRFERPVITDNEFLYEAWIRESGIGMYVQEPEGIEEAVLGVDKERYDEFIENIRRFKGRLPPAGIGRNMARQIETICAS